MLIREIVREIIAPMECIQSIISWLFLDLQTIKSEDSRKWSADFHKWKLVHFIKFIETYVKYRS